MKVVYTCYSTHELVAVQMPGIASSPKFRKGGVGLYYCFFWIGTAA